RHIGRFDIIDRVHCPLLHSPLAHLGAKLCALIRKTRAMPGRCGNIEFSTVCSGLAAKAACGSGWAIARLRRITPAHCAMHKPRAIEHQASRTAKHYGRMSAAAGAGCRSRPTPGLVGNTSDLITTGTAPEVSRTAPMSM